MEQPTDLSSVAVPVYGNKDLRIGLLKAIEIHTGVKLISRGDQ